MRKLLSTLVFIATFSIFGVSLNALASDGFGPPNTSCYFQPNLRQYLQSPGTGSDAAYDWIACPNPFGTTFPGQVDEFLLGSYSEPIIYDRFEMIGWRIPSRYERQGFAWREYRQTYEVIIEQINDDVVREIFHKTLLGSGADPNDPSQVVGQDPYIWFVDPAPGPAGAGNQPLVIDSGNLNHVRYRFSKRFIAEVDKGIAWSAPSTPISGYFTVNARKSVLPLPGDFQLSAQTSCVDYQPRINLSWTSSSDSSSYIIYKNNGPLTTTGDLSFLDTNVLDSTSYQYLIRATNAAGMTDSNTVNITTPDCRRPVVTLTATPSQVIKGTPNGITVNWQVASGLTDPQDWIGLYISSVTDNRNHYQEVDQLAPFWQYTNGQISGSFSVNTPSVIGTFQFRYLLDDGFERVASSNNVEVINPPAPTLTLTASPSIIQLGDSSTLTWSSTNADRVVSSNFGANSVNGTKSVSPESSTLYTLKVAGAGGEVERNAFVTVELPPPPSSPLRAMGLFIADQIEIDGENIRIVYDSRINVLTLLGFSDLFVPKILETSP